MMNKLVLLSLGLVLQAEAVSISVEPISVETTLYRDVILEDGKVRYSEPCAAYNVFTFAVTAIGGDVYLPDLPVDYRIVSDSSVSFEAMGIISSARLAPYPSWNFFIAEGDSEKFTFELEYKQAQDGFSFVEIDGIRFGNESNVINQISGWQEWGGMDSEIVWLEGRGIPEPSALMLLTSSLVFFRRKRNIY